MTGTEQAELLFLLMHSKEREDLKSKVFHKSKRNCSSIQIC